MTQIFKWTFNTDTFVGKQELLYMSYNGDANDYFKKLVDNIHKNDIFDYSDDTQITYHDKDGFIVNIRIFENDNIGDEFIDDENDVINNDFIDDEDEDIVIDENEDIDVKISMYIIKMRDDMEKYAKTSKKINDKFNNIVNNYDADNINNDTNIDDKLTFKF